ncbi:Piso0_000116 [Millerozyma farinosa CBS 7064]|uniref:Piso0_000116 protein n=1 Tax=Pichia sorbitophila (strain ATCC MYA-4447 / BCRC 22081 / CBS 7064 / NBRC 10061 / NRRL Y-12695) TaxID=559304 RepID=G8YT46_PICSO|nr:Piso0_000116 [Millerozyma farinosa CBS 7064]
MSVGIHSEKRRSEDSDEGDSKKGRPSSKILGITRSISACQRCRIKKIRCDQNFPKCSKCDKARVECIGLDPATGREVSRSYIVYLEDRVSSLEQTLASHGIGIDGLAPAQPPLDQEAAVAGQVSASTHVPWSGEAKQPDSSPDRGRPSGSGLSFSRILSTALKVNEHSKIPTARKDPLTAGAQRGERTLPAILPPKATAMSFIKIFFSQANAQLPVLHREEFLINYFIPVYGNFDSSISLASNYTAINPSAIEISSNMKEEDTWIYRYKSQFQRLLSAKKGSSANPAEISEEIVTPPEFYKPLYFLYMVFAVSSSVHHLQYHPNISESFRVAAAKYADSVFSASDQLQALQATLLLALYSMMRPTVPGIWYVIGSALRMSVDMGLHNESSSRDLDSLDSYTKDKRRRLFWCTYSLDRQICFYLGRPVGIPDESIATPFPSELDDALIIPHDNANADYSRNISGMPTYKVVSISFFRIRQIQSEVRTVLYENSELPRRFASLQDWRQDVISRLQVWKSQAPKTQRKMNCDFNLEFVNLNYSHTLLMIHGLSPKHYRLSPDDFVQVSIASKEIVYCYNQLCLNRCINYTWAAVHNLFMAGSCFLYAIYSSKEACEQNSFEEVKKITEGLINVLASLRDKAEAAVSCCQTFEVLSAVVIKLRYNRTVRAYSSNIPSHQQIANNQPVGYVNSNLQHLVDNLKEQATSSESEMFSAPQAPANPVIIPGGESREETTGVGEQHQNSGLDVDAQGQRDLNNDATSPRTFEWISNNPTKVENESASPGFAQNDLNLFFNTLENVSPASAKSPVNSHTGYNLQHNLASPQSNLVQNQIIMQGDGYRENASSSQAAGESPLSDDRMGSSNKDGKRTLEMINKLTTDPIWDQFFGSSGTDNFSGYWQFQ